MSQNKPLVKYLWHYTFVIPFQAWVFPFLYANPYSHLPQFHISPWHYHSHPEGLCVSWVCLLDRVNSFQAPSVHGCDWQRRVLFPSVSGAWSRVNTQHDERERFIQYVNVMLRLARSTEHIQIAVLSARRLAEFLNIPAILSHHPQG